MENFDKRMLKKEGEELQQYLAFRRKACRMSIASTPCAFRQD